MKLFHLNSCVSFSSGKEECRKPVILVTHSYRDMEVSFLYLMPFPLTSHAEPEPAISLTFCRWSASWSFTAVPSYTVWAAEFLLYWIPHLPEMFWSAVPTDGCLYHSFLWFNPLPSLLWSVYHLESENLHSKHWNIWNGLYFYILCNPLFFILTPGTSTKLYQV